ncbi:MAG: sterol desaturase family protein [Bacteroidia bacterium]
MLLIQHIFLTTAIFAFMEAWAWFSHKYLLHGPLWFIHRSHHRQRKSWFEWNDSVSLLYAALAGFLIFKGAPTGSWHLDAGLGIALYGVFYFLFHDIIIHQRVRYKHPFKNAYVRRLIRAHKQHHRHGEKNPGEAYGFLFAHKKYSVK